MKRQDTKICVVCNRPMTWRRKWAKNWADVKYCSNACRRNKASEPRRDRPRLALLCAAHKKG